MKTKEELNELSGNIGKAIYAYHIAIFDNLKESGKEYDVISDYDDDDDEHNGLRLTIIGRHNESVDICVDKVRCAKYESDAEVVEVHICEDNYKACDYWCVADVLGDDLDYVYDNINWD